MREQLRVAGAVHRLDAHLAVLDLDVNMCSRYLSQCPEVFHSSAS